jgi:uncharacterized protein (TIGR03435 family)
MKRAILLAAFGLGVVCAQDTHSGPTFEVVSIKKAPPPQGPGGFRTGCFGGPGSGDPGTYTCYNSTVALMAFQAYGLKLPQMKGANDDKDKYNVHAKIPAGATREDVKLMMQAMLAERFKLTFHYEKQEIQGYNLTLAKGGPKLKATPADAAETTSRNLGIAKDTDGFPMPGAGFRGIYPSRANGLIRMFAAKISMDEFAGNLTSMLQQQVTNETGLTEKYDFTTTFTMESIGQSNPGSEPAIGLGIFAAFEKELGLKLEPAKTMMDVFIIDHVDKTGAEN